MDGVLVASDTNIVGSGSSSSSGSVGFYKSEICMTWEEFGHCRYGSKCQVYLSAALYNMLGFLDYVNVVWNTVLFNASVFVLKYKVFSLVNFWILKCQYFALTPNGFIIFFSFLNLLQTEGG